MSKLTLTFNLPEERSDATAAQNAWALVFTIQDLDNYLRSINKHGHEDFKDPSACEAAQKIRDKLWELVNERYLQELFE